jgi:hypothetical protein
MNGADSNPADLFATAASHAATFRNTSLALSRRAATLEVPRSISQAGPVHLRVDSTGLRLCGPGDWLIETRHPHTPVLAKAEPEEGHRHSRGGLWRVRS